jgi:ATP-dependent DNA helicase RecQ
VASRKRTVEEERIWQAVRQVVLARDNWTCVECGEQPPQEELDVHHLVPRAAGGRDVAGNCVVLCDGCHAGRHPNLQVGLARRTIESWALRLARWLDVRRELPAETQALDAGLHLFGVDRFREGQLEAVLAALKGESLLVVRPTGSGKSLCYQMPAILKGQPASYVVAPTKALMVDQAMGLHRRKLPGTFINSDVGKAEKEARYEMLEQDAWAMIYFAPERFGGLVNRNEIARLTRYRPSFLVVDEAHCIDSWGQDFRPDYGRLGALRQALGNPPILALTATAGVETQARILQSLGIPEARVLLSDVDRPNIALVRVLERSNAERARIVARLLANLDGRALIFVPTKNVGADVQAAMAAVGHELPFYHGQLPKNERDSLQARFSGQHEPPLTALITTNAFGMGVDIPDVRLVVHWQHPATVEDYLQEFGRAGRDGLPAVALLFSTGPSETGLLAAMAKFTTDGAVKKGTLTQLEADAALERRVERIDQMQVLVAQQSHCFRAELNEVLQGRPRKRRRSLSRWLLDLVFSRRVRVIPAGVCCDHCHPGLVGQARAGTLAPSGRPTHQCRSLPNLRLPHLRWHGRPRLSWRSLRRLARRIRQTVLAVIVLSIVVSFVVAAVEAWQEYQHDLDVQQTAQVYKRYVANHMGQNYTKPHVRSYKGAFIACGRPRRGGAPLCLVINPDRQPSNRVSGSYSRRGDRRVACTGEARRLCARR